MGLMDRFKTHLDPPEEGGSGLQATVHVQKTEPLPAPSPLPALAGSGARLWITARLDGDALSVSVAGSEEYLADDPAHRTRTVSATLDVLDETGLRSARAVLVPLVRVMSQNQRDNLEPRRLAAIPTPEREAVDAVRKALDDVLTAYRAPLTRLVRRMARAAEDAAYTHDAQGAA